MHRGQVLSAMYLDNFVCFSSSVVRRDVFARVGLFDESLPLAIDYELWLRAACEFEFDFVDEPLVKYRTGHANLSQRGAERLRIVLGIMERFIAQRGGREALPPSLIRRAFAETYCSLGFAERDRALLTSLRCYVRALGFRPLRYGTWRGLATAALPEAARRAVRRALGRSTDWRTLAQPADVSQEAPS